MMGLCYEPTLYQAFTRNERGERATAGVGGLKGGARTDLDKAPFFQPVGFQC